MERKRKIAEERRWKRRANRNIFKNCRRREKGDGKKKNHIEEEKKYNKKGRKNLEYFKKNDQLHGLFYFVIQAVNVLPIYYIYEH